MTSTATQAFLDRDTQVTEALRPYVAGDADWDDTRQELLDVEWADVPHGTPNQLMGKDGGEYIAGLAPGDAPVPGSWDELLAAQDHGILTADQVRELLTVLVAKSDDRTARG